MKNSTILKASLAGLLFMFSISVSYAQEVTSTSGYYPSSAEYYESLPVLTITPQSRSLTLPPAVDNSTKPYFPQKDNSNELYVYDQKTTAACQSVATVWNTFTYEVNRLRNLTSNTQLINDANGRQVLTRQLLSLHNETIIDITGFVHGTYTVSLSQGGRIIATETLVIAR